MKLTRNPAPDEQTQTIEQIQRDAVAPLQKGITPASTANLTQTNELQNIKNLEDELFPKIKIDDNN
jgi:hypothetical protein